MNGIMALMARRPGNLRFFFREVVSLLMLFFFFFFFFFPSFSALPSYLFLFFLLLLLSLSFPQKERYMWYNYIYSYLWREGNKKGGAGEGDADKGEREKKNIHLAQNPSLTPRNNRNILHQGSIKPSPIEKIRKQHPPSGPARISVCK